MNRFYNDERGDGSEKNALRGNREALQAELEAAGAVFHGASCRCVFHEDHNASGSIYEKDGIWRYRCFTCGEGVGGDIFDVRAQLKKTTVGQELKAARNGSSVAKPNQRKKLVDKPKKPHATKEKAAAALVWSVANNDKIEKDKIKVTDVFDFQNLDGSIFGAEVRMTLPMVDPETGKPKKKIRRMSPRGGGWVTEQPKGKKWPIFNAPKVTGAKQAYMGEGPRKAKAFESLGLIGTSLIGGASALRSSDVGPLAGVDELVLSPDNDASGMGCMIGIAQAGLARNPMVMVKILELPDLPPKGDIVDFVAMRREAGKSDEEIRLEIETLAAAAPLYTPPAAEPDGEDAVVVADRDGSDDDAPSPVKAAPYVSFPVEVLPPVLANLVTEGAVALGCDAAQIALPALAACSAAIGNSRRISLKASWPEPSVIWAVTVLPSGALKSPALDLALEPIRKAQHEAIEKWKGDMEGFRKDKAEWETRDKKLRGAEPIPPVCSRLTVSDTTIEALASRLAAQESRRGLLCERDELSGWLKGFNQYKAKGGADEAHWLTLHGARTLTVDRKTGDEKMIYVRLAFVAITGTIQPGILRGCLNGEHLQSGLGARLLMAMPPAKRRQWNEQVVSEGTRRHYAAMLAALMSVPMGGAPLDPDPVDLPLTPDAKAFFIAFYNAHNAAEQATEGGDISAAWSKLEGYAARLALILHCVRMVTEGADPAAVDAASMAAGIALARWFGGEAERVYSMLGGGAVEDESAALFRFIGDRGGRITTRELREAKSKYHGAGAGRDALEKLVEAGYGRWVPLPPGPQGGRPSEVFEVASTLSPKPLSSPAIPVSAIHETPRHDSASGGIADADSADDVKSGGIGDSQIAVPEDDCDRAAGNPGVLVMQQWEEA